MYSLLYVDSNDGKAACTEQKFVENFVSEIYSHYHLKCDDKKEMPSGYDHRLLYE